MLRLLPLTALACILHEPTSTPSQPGSAGGPPPLAFEKLHFNLEHNATDGDAEIVLDLDAGVGLKRLVVLDPCDRLMLRFTERELGQKKIRLESPEPSLQAITQAYQQGTYTFLGVSDDGQFVHGQVMLSHQLPAAPSIGNPAQGATNVPRTGVVATWAPAIGASHYRIEIDQDGLGLVLKADVSAGVTSFALPDHWLQPGEECTFAVAAVRPDGNLTVSQVEFTVAP